MIFRKISIPIILALTSIACSTNTTKEKIEISKENFPLIEQLEFEEIIIPPVLLDVSNLCIVDSFLFIAQKRNDTIFHIFKLPDCKLITGFGKMGRGPNEFFNNFSSSTFKPVFDSIPKFGVSNGVYSIRYYQISDFLDNRFEPYKTIDLPPELNGFQSVTYVKDSLIIGAPYNVSAHIIQFNPSSDSLSSFKEFAIQFPGLESRMRTIYMTYMSIRPDNNKLVVSYGSFGKIDIYDLTNGELQTITYKDFPPIEENLSITRNSSEADYRFNRNQKIFCWEIVATNNHIYAKVLNTEYNNLVDGMSFSRNFIPEIHVFDWDGSPVRIIKPDKYYFKFYVSPNDEYLYAIDRNIEDIIYRIKL